MTPPKITQKIYQKMPPPPGAYASNGFTSASWQDELFWNGVKRSAIVHFGIFFILFLSWVIFPSNPVVITPSIRVDLVALPDIKKKDLQKFQPSDFQDLNQKLDEAGKRSKQTLEDLKKTPPKESKAPEDEMTLKKEKSDGVSKKDLKSAIERIKALERIEEDLNKGAEAKKVLAKGNQISKGSDLDGEPGVDINEYASKLRDKLRENWDLPLWLTQQELSARVVIFLDATGKVTNMVFKKSSGNEQFDSLVKATIDKSAPFAPPPNEILDGGVTLGFPL